MANWLICNECGFTSNNHNEAAVKEFDNHKCLEDEAATEEARIDEMTKSVKYVKHLTNDELLERLAAELVRTHQETGIDLAYWETAREVVERFYEVRVVVEIGKKKE